MRVKSSDAKDILDLLMGVQDQDGENALSEKKSLDVFAILNLPARLRKTAVELHRVGKARAEMIAEITGEKREVERAHLEELFQMGFLHIEEQDDIVFFSVRACRL
jgi:DNA-binding transcriptional ArsR family regulator